VEDNGNVEETVVDRSSVGDGSGKVFGCTFKEVHNHLCRCRCVHEYRLP
jgi:hypothetical protein